MKNYLHVRTGLFAFTVGILMMLTQKSYALHPWVAPTPEELSMKYVPEAPGAPAVILDYEEVDDDISNHSYSYYVRIKVLTEAGKDAADVALTYAADVVEYDYASENYTDIAGRTIEPDGTIVPFTGKPYVKTLERSHEGKVLSKVFTLPNVQVGSILEYRYSYRYPDYLFSAADWLIQKDYYVKHAKFSFLATDKPLDVGRGDAGDNLVAWTSILPKGSTVKRQTSIDTFTNTKSASGTTYSLEVTNVPPKPDEEYMPPIGGMTYQVHFYYFGYSKIEKYWIGEGKHYSGVWNQFIDSTSLVKGIGGGNGAVKNAVDGIISSGDTDEAKLRKIYSAVQALDNTQYSREKTKQEDQAAGLHNINNASDVWAHKSGTPNQLTELFVAMARNAGFKAYLMDISSRNRWIFDKNLARWGQMDHFVAIVNVGGKEVFFDPGVKYCKFGELAWQHTESSGIRQTDGGTEIATTPFLNYQQSSIKYVAVLTLDEHGIATGQMQEMFDGAPALKWRLESATKDEADLKTDIINDLKERLPGGMDVSIKTILNLENPNQPLVVNYSAQGPVATTTGKRLLIPGDIFRVNAKPLLSASTRISAVDLDYAVQVIDAVKITLPQTMQVESLPEKQNSDFMKSAVYIYTADAVPVNSFLVKRQYVLGNYIFPVANYDATREYFSKIAQADKGVVLVKMAAAGNAN